MKHIIELIKLSRRFSKIFRTVGYGKEHCENDSEHSYQLALICWGINQNYKLGFNDEKILKFALVHDLVEVYAGDTDAHDDKKKILEKHKKEKEALQILKKDFSNFKDLIENIEKYELKKEIEAQFVCIVDKLLPQINTYLSKENYYKDRKISKKDWRNWLNRKINFPLDKKLQNLLNQFIAYIEENNSQVFYRK